MTIESLVPRVRRALGVSSSHDAEEIPDLIRSAIRRLLRDYNFPKTVAREEFVTVEDDRYFTLPAGFKRELAVMFHDVDDDTYSDPLSKSNGFRLPAATGETSHYWLEGLRVYIDTPIDAEAAGTKLILFYQSQSVDDNADWITEDFEDAVFYLAVLRGAAEFRKTEVAGIYGALWADEQKSLAIYLNELEWNNVVMIQREHRIRADERYPI